MKRSIQIIAIGFVIVLLDLTATAAAADEIRVAVASDFTDASRVIAGRFEQKSGQKVTLAFGSTGKLYAQIKNGAPFEAYVAAVVKRPRLLE